MVLVGFLMLLCLDEGDTPTHFQLTDYLENVPPFSFTEKKIENASYMGSFLELANPCRT